MVFKILRWLKRLFRHNKIRSNSGVSPKLINAIPSVNLYRKPFTIKDQIQGMLDAKLPTTKDLAKWVAGRGKVALANHQEVTLNLLDLIDRDHFRVLELGTNSFHDFHTSLIKESRDLGMEISTTARYSFDMQITFRRRN